MLVLNCILLPLNKTEVMSSLDSAMLTSIFSRLFWVLGSRRRVSEGINLEGNTSEGNT